MLAGALLMLAASARAQGGPPVTTNRAAAEELKGLSIDAGARKVAPEPPVQPTLPPPNTDQVNLANDVATSARQAKAVVVEHTPQSTSSAILLGVAIGCGAVAVLVIGWFVNRRRR